MNPETIAEVIIPSVVNPETQQNKSPVQQTRTWKQAFRVRTAGELSKKIDAYFVHCELMEKHKNGKEIPVNIPNINGLALWLQVDLNTLVEYSVDNSPSAIAIKKGISKINDHLTQGALKSIYPAVPVIVELKRGDPAYKDRVDEAQQGNVTVNVQVNTFSKAVSK